MSGLPFSDMYRNSGRLEDQLLPTSNSGGPGGSLGVNLGAGGGSGGLGALARSASLSARKKDPYMYSSDDVESGLGNMDVSGERNWGMGGYQGQQAYVASGFSGPGRDQMGQTQFPFSHHQNPQLSTAQPPNSAVLGRSPLATTHLTRGSTSNVTTTGAGGMHPPPPPLALHTRPTGSRADSGGSASSSGGPDATSAGLYAARSQSSGQASPYTPSAAHLQAQQAQAQAHGHAQAQAQALANARAQMAQAQTQPQGMSHQSPYNPYIPLSSTRGGSDPTYAPAASVSAGGAGSRDATWEYRSIVPPRERIPSSSSHHSHYSELSPFSHPDARLPSPSSPMMNPYEPYPSTPGSAGLGGYYSNSSTARQGSFGQQAQSSGQMQGHGAIGEERKDSSASQHRNSSSSRSHSQSANTAQGLALPSSSPMSTGGSGMNTPWSAYAPSPDALAPLVPPQPAQPPQMQQNMGPPQAPQQRPNGGRSQSSHNAATYAASQPVTPANKYNRGPPQTVTGAYGAAVDDGMYGNGQDPNGVAEGGNRGRTGHAGHEQDRLQPQQYQQQQQSRRQSMQDQQVQGLRDVNDLSELTPVRNKRPVGRRADPMRPGKYISPLQCLTSDIAQTYTLCNPQFRYESSDNPRRVLTKPSKPVHNDGVDNEDWDYILYVNDVLGGENGGDRYLILDVLGQGTFGQVVKCQNFRTHDIVAVKVVKNKPAYLNQSKMEVAILELLNNQWDPHDQHHILRMLDSFNHKNHLCLVFECLSSNLYELIKQNQFKGLSLQLVKVFTAQLLECLGVLKDARLIHCDLKPENILLKSLQSPQIKIIDFGSACHEMQTVYTYIQSRFYRSPEVLLGLPYSTSIDMWSLGCIVVELFLGLPLFPGTSEYNQLSRIVDMLGNPPSHLLEVGKQTHEFYRVSYDHQGRKTYDLKSMEQYATEHRTNEQPSKQYFKQTKLDDIIMQYAYSKKNPKQSDMEKEMAQRTAFVDFVKGLVNLDPIKRWSPQQAAKHPFVTGEKYTGPYQPSANPVNHKKATPSPMASPTTPSKKSYGGISQSHQNSPSRTNRIQSDAGLYAQSNQAAYTPQQVRQNTGAGNTPYSPTSYDSAHRSRLPSQSHASAQPPAQQTQWQPMGPPANYQPRMTSQNMGASASHGQLRAAGMSMQQASGSVVTNPPPNSYYPATRNRANTINQMDAIPPALARLTHMSMPDPSGQRNLTPVLNRGDDAYREWERRQQGGHSKNSSLAQTSYPQLEYLQEQAELAAYNSGWMMPPPAHTHNRQPTQGLGMGGMYGPPPPTSYGQGGQGHTPGASYGGAGHRSRPSGQMGPSGPYQMQPPIPPQQRQQTAPSIASSPYDPPGNRSFLPTFPPPAATTSHGHSHSMSAGPPISGNTYDSYDNGPNQSQMLYTPIQGSYPHSPMAPGQASPYGPGSAGQQGGPGQGQGQGYGAQGLGIMGHQTRASFSGPFSPAGPPQGQSQNPFMQQQQQQAQAQAQAQGHGQGGGSPRYQRRSQQYGA